MKLTFAPRGILQVDDATIIFRNFAGKGSTYNREGDRNFSLLIDDEELKDKLIAEGWNVKVKPPREEGEIPFMHLPVKVKFNDRGPIVYLKTGNAVNTLDEDSIGILDSIDILGVDLDIRPYDWELRDGKSGRTAYLQSIHVTQDVDSFAARYEDESEETPW
jgi:hypothetical protein